MAKTTRVRLYMDCQRGLGATSPKPIGVLPEQNWDTLSNRTSPSHHMSLWVPEETLCSPYDLMARRQQFVWCLIKDHQVLLDKVGSLPSRGSGCGYQMISPSILGCQILFSIFIIWLVDILLVIGIHCDLRFYGIVIDLIITYLVDVFLKPFKRGSNNYLILNKEFF